MKPAQKIPLIEHCASELAKLEGESDIDFVLRICEINPTSWLDDDSSYTYARRCISDRHVTDDQLGSLAEYLDRVVIVDDAGLWEPDSIRVFLSHLAKHREFVGEVAAALRTHALHGFVAHDSIEVSKKWADEIQRALRSTQVFVGIAHPGFSNSVWVNQEIGWAMGRNIPLFMVRMGEDPLGFPSDTQWASMVSTTPKDIARAIAGWINQLPDFTEDIGGRLITVLAGVQNYRASEEAAMAVALLDRLTEEQWQRLEEVYWRNDQIYGCVLADRQLKPFFAKHGRQYPPPRPDASAR
jgi:hypothetical protein